jgi:hypothetical protein
MHSGLDCVPNHKNRAVSLPEKLFNFFKKSIHDSWSVRKEARDGKIFSF